MSSTSRSRTSITVAPRPKARKPMESVSAFIAPSWMSSTGWRSARRSIAPSTSCRPTLMPGSPNTTSNAPIKAAGASARPRCRPFLTRCHWRRRNSWRHDHRRQSYRCKPPTPSVRSSISYYTYCRVDDFGGGLQRDLATLGPFAIAIRRDVPVFAEPAHALLGPGLARCHLCSGPVQQARDLPIRHQTSQLAHERNQIVCDRIVAPAGCVQLDAQLQCRVIATVPAQDHVEPLAVLAHDDLVGGRRAGSFCGSQP